MTAAAILEGGHQPGLRAHRGGAESSWHVWQGDASRGHYAGSTFGKVLFLALRKRRWWLMQREYGMETVCYSILIIRLVVTHFLLAFAEDFTFEFRLVRS